MSEIPSGAGDTKKIETMSEEYRIVSIEPVEAPGDLGGENWHCYVIDQGKNRIRGYRRGGRQSVTDSVEELVLRLNLRRMGAKGRVHLYTLTERKRAAAK